MDLVKFLTRRLMMFIIPEGGGGSSPAFLSVIPSGAINFGSIATGSTKDISFTVVNSGDLTTVVNSIAVGGAPYSIVGAPVLPRTLVASDSFTFTLRFSPIVAGTFNDTLTITASPGTNNAPYTAAISGTGVGVGAALSVTPGPVVFPNTITTHSATPINVVVKNVGTLAVTLTGITLLGGAPYGLTGLPGFNLVLNPGDTTNFNVTFTPTSVGIFNDTVRIATTTIGNVDTAVQGSGVPIIPVAVIGQNIRKLVTSFVDNLGNVLHKFIDSSNFNNTLLGGTLIFNGTLWDVPGYEKALRRLQVFYENYGVATLTLTTSVFRPSVSPDNFDQQVQSINIGTNAADLSERSAFFDVQTSGEIIIIQLSRAANGGPVSLIGFLPEFEEKGEKVENT